MAEITSKRVGKTVRDASIRAGWFDRRVPHYRDDDERNGPRS
jgi:hypothetical protein